MQVMTIEFARNELGLTGANSTEFDPATPHPVIDLMDSQRDVTDKGGTMRLGAYIAELAEGSQVAHAYGRRSCPSATATATSSTPATAASSRARASCARATRPTGGWSSSSSWRPTRSGSAPRRTPSSRAAPTGRRRCSASSCGAALDRAEGRRPHLFPVDEHADRPVAPVSAEEAQPAFRVAEERPAWQGRRIAVAIADVEGPGGHRHEREVVHHPGAVGDRPGPRRRDDHAGPPVPGGPRRRRVGDPGGAARRRRRARRAHGRPGAGRGGRACGPSGSSTCSRSTTRRGSPTSRW